MMAGVFDPDPQTQEELLAAKFGAPVYLNSRKQIAALGQSFWAEYYANQHICIIFDHAEQTFYVYNDANGLFELKSEHTVRKEIADLLIKSSLEWKYETLVTNSGKPWSDWYGLQRHAGAKTIGEIIQMLKGSRLEIGSFKKRNTVMHLANCMLELQKDGSVIRKNFSPDYRSRNASPISYDPNAQCPEFKKRILGHLSESDRLALQKYSGQCFLGYNLTQTILILWGVAGASKGAFVRILKGLIGESNVGQLRTNQLEGRFEISRYAKRTLLVGPDVKPDFLSCDGAMILKGLIGGDTFDIEYKNSNGAESTAGVWNAAATANSSLKLQLNDDEDAWRRRLVIVYYNTPFVGDRDPEIEEKLLRDEGSGILNWAIEGAKKLIADGIFNLSEEQKSRVENMINESRSLGLFLNEEMYRAESSDLTTNEVVDRYYQFCSQHEWTPLLERTLRSDLKVMIASKFGVSESNSVERNGACNRGFRGIGLRIPTEAME
jgi:P4 family phage/plasmid primase-like protien